MNFFVEIKFDSKMKFLIFKFFDWIISFLLNVINWLIIDFVTYKIFFFTLKQNLNNFQKNALRDFIYERF